jgi:hypothetical protein
MLPDDAYVLCSDRPQSPNISLRAQTLDHRAQRQGQPVTVGSQQHLASQHQLLRASPHPIVRLMDAAHVVSDVVPDVVQAFRQTHTNRSRIEALEALAAELTPFEWRHLQSKLNTKDFRCDIVAALPVELVASIFAHLDVSTPYRLQRVRKRHLLSSVSLRNIIILLTMKPRFRNVGIVSFAALTFCIEV